MAETALKPQSFTVADAVRALEQVIEEVSQSYYYEEPALYVGCVYVWGGCPCCLIGKMVHRLGWPLDRLNGIEEDATTLEDNYPEIIFEGDVLAFLQAVQERQDRGTRWHAILEIYRTMGHDAFLRSSDRVSGKI